MHARIGPRGLYCCGWGFLLASLAVPDSRGLHRGAHWLIAGPRYGAQLLGHGVRSWGAPGAGAALLVGAALLAGTAANLSVLVRLRAPWAYLAMLLPLVPFTAYMALWLAGRVAQEAAPWTLFYFFPWASGIVLIHAARVTVAAVRP